jgi:predicted nucleic acid-binding protein
MCRETIDGIILLAVLHTVDSQKQPIIDIEALERFSKKEIPWDQLRQWAADRKYVDQTLLKAIQDIRKLGNFAAHYVEQVTQGVAEAASAPYRVWISPEEAYRSLCLVSQFVMSVIEKWDAACRDDEKTLPKPVYFDTSVWLAPYDDLTEPRKEQVPAIERLINKHKSNEITLHTSRQVMKELRDLLRNSEKAEKASKALERLYTLHLTQLPLSIAVYGRTVYGEARYGQKPKFNEISLREKDKLIAEFMTANNLDYFVSVDNDFLKRKAEIESLLARERTSVLEPQELLRELRN